MNAPEIARRIDSTNLKLNSSDADLCTLCDEAAEYGFATVCIYPADVTICSTILYNTPVKVCTVIGFPHGRSSLAAKRVEILEAKEHGASEVDVVINYHNLRTGEKGLAAEEVSTLCEVAREVGLGIKIIVETSYLKKKQKLDALAICEKAKVDFIQISTGFAPAVADEADVALLNNKRSNNIRIKASGGIQTIGSALKLMEAGADRVGIQKAGKLLAAAKELAQ